MEREDCRKRWIKLDSKINKGLWSQEENKRLHEGVAKYSTVWTEVAQVVGTRQPDQCAKRWQHFLDPDLDRSEWTPEEDNILLAEVEKRGRNWAQIVDEVLHRRSANDAKNRGNPSSSGQRGEARVLISTTANSELGHEDLHIDSDMFSQSANSAGKQPSNTASPSELPHNGSTPEILGEMEIEHTGSLESWVDYVMGTGILMGTDCPTPALCNDDSRINTAQSEERKMQLDAITRTTTTTTTTSNTITTDPRLTVDELQTSLDWDWDQVPDMDLTPPDRESIQSRTMILQQMQPEQISRVMDFLLSWNTPIDVKIVNRE
ncbi:uncharacterized protein BHQ10_000739 [Talaromyces amestolkiae]|uniref:Myb-like domain-containing protein n=1 Tax=Talaromyces amestolkiae TaxID=1196081 RepID=A0A364KMF8_TALAM|nr:uncharacterized protein BHQ10_000739 [Talaromyces amestolkiae]RAO64727.1 hypothetical protein BHQ10_000739 [Talaromyces amestolkiae]